MRDIVRLLPTLSLKERQPTPRLGESRDAQLGNLNRERFTRLELLESPVILMLNGALKSRLEPPTHEYLDEGEGGDLRGILLEYGHELSSARVF
jgi:hypothetical protein